MRQQGISGWRGVRAGSCYAWHLPADPTCAAVARQVFRDAVAELGLGSELLDDCILMASELGANTLHANTLQANTLQANTLQANTLLAHTKTRAGGGGDRLVSVATDKGCEPVTSASPTPLTPPTPAVPQSPSASPELWLYLRGLGTRRELVCKVFDSCRGWRHGSAPVVGRAPAQALTGRGLAIVHELSGGRWGHHPTRARLGGWGLRGKAVWFAVPAPLAHARLVDVTGLRAYTRSADVTAERASQRLSARQAARELEAMLHQRGFTGQLVRADEPTADMSVLSFCPELSVRCRSGVVSLTTSEGPRQRLNYADLVEATEQAVRLYEELELGAELAAAL